MLSGKHNFYKIVSLCQLFRLPENFYLSISKIKPNFKISNKIKIFHFFKLTQKILLQNCPSIFISFSSQFFILTWDRALWADCISCEGTQRFPWPLHQGHYKSCSQGRQRGGGTVEPVFLIFQLKLFIRALNIYHLIQLFDLYHVYNDLCIHRTLHRYIKKPLHEQSRNSIFEHVAWP